MSLCHFLLLVVSESPLVAPGKFLAPAPTVSILSQTHLIRLHEFLFRVQTLWPLLWPLASGRAVIGGIPTAL
jgi:hypothetical protein